MTISTMGSAKIVPCILLASAGFACAPDTGTANSGGDTEEWADGRTQVDTYLPWGTPRIDAIVVIDDSPSMRAYTEKIASNAGGFAELMKGWDAGDVRVAFTTTSVAGPTCEGSRAQGGAPTMDTCRTHLEDFEGPDEHGENGGGVEDLRSVCEQACSLETIERVKSYGSRPDVGGLAVRPWFDGPGGTEGSNLAEGVDFDEALACVMLQGFSGCRFESPIEAAARMVERYSDPDDPMFGFRRPDAALLILTISDEDDCSHPDSSGTIFSPEGERVFWSAGADEALSSICVNAGTINADGSWEVVDYDLSGARTSDPSAAVLTPGARLFEAFEQAGEYLDDRFEPVVSVIGGFDQHGDLHYSDPEAGSPYEDYAAAFGSGPGCASQTPEGEPLLAAPSGRLQQVALPGATFPICEQDWSVGFEPLLDRVRPQQQPWCLPGEDEWACVEEVDGLLDCVVEEVQGEARLGLVPCERDAAGMWVIDEQTQFYAVPEGEHACWAYLGDFDAVTESHDDDPSDVCVDAKRRGDLRIARQADSPLPYDAYYAARCRPC